MYHGCEEEGVAFEALLLPPPASVDAYADFVMKDGLKLKPVLEEEEGPASSLSDCWKLPLLAARANSWSYFLDALSRACFKYAG